MTRAPHRILRALGYALLYALALAATCALVLAAGELHAQPAATAQSPADSAMADSAMADSALEARTRAVAARLRCPVCQGLSLADSPSELSQEMKNVVREQLAAGASPQAVEAYFVAKYGEWILMEPAASGFNLLVYLLPVLMLLAGAGVVVVVVRRWTAGDEGGARPRAVRARPVEGVELEGHQRLPQAVP